MSHNSRNEPVSNQSFLLYLLPATKQALVQWQGQTIESGTWIDEADFVAQFPYFSLEDKAIFLQGDVLIGGPQGTTTRHTPFEVYSKRIKGRDNGKELASGDNNIVIR